MWNLLLRHLLWTYLWQEYCKQPVVQLHECRVNTLLSACVCIGLLCIRSMFIFLPLPQSLSAFQSLVSLVASQFSNLGQLFWKRAVMNVARVGLTSEITPAFSWRKFISASCGGPRDPWFSTQGECLSWGFGKTGLEERRKREQLMQVSFCKVPTESFCPLQGQQKSPIWTFSSPLFYSLTLFPSFLFFILSFISFCLFFLSLSKAIEVLMMS